MKPNSLIQNLQQLLLPFAVIAMLAGVAIALIFFQEEENPPDTEVPYSETDEILEASSVSLHSQARFLEAMQRAEEEIADGDFEIVQLLIASGYRLSLLNIMSAEIEEGSHVDLLNRAMGLMPQDRLESVRDLIRYVIAEDPHHLQAQGWYGQILAKQQSAEFATWYAALPEDSQDHPAIWFACGLAAEQKDEDLLAARCYLNALLQSPLHAELANRFSAVVSKLPQEKEAAIAVDYTHHVKALNTLVNDLAHTQDFEMMQQAAKNLLELGRPQAAIGWAIIAQQQGYEAEWIDEIRNASDQERKQQGTHADTLESLNASEILSRVTLPNWSQFQFTDLSTSENRVETSVVFRDVAHELGIDFQYENGSLPNLPLGHLFETTGGGVAAFDYDCDGLPDLFLAQGGDWRRGSDNLKESNRLYRNQAPDAFAEVADAAGFIKTDFSQGVTCGDFNNDGFQDLFVCNLDGNRFYENLGDGTFTEITQEAAITGEDWSLSAAFADLNGDGLSDLYVVNYLNAEEVRATECDFNGKPRACPPTMFPGTSDQVYLNMGNGQFRDVSDSIGVGEHLGKGMGLVVADFTGNGSLEVFASNDSEENFFFAIDENAAAKAIPHFVERAAISGLATDASGRTQASMGVATGDMNSDGRLDLLVTNFYGESNTLYVQQDKGTFQDRTSSTGQLKSGSMQMLGFGTQFLDADLDGELDLVIANGHVDRTTVTGEPDLMRPQFYLNSGEGRLKLARGSSIGSGFEKPSLGRAVATLDWNRDGRTDFCITHLDQPFSLFQNETIVTGNFVRFKLVATHGERDPIGTEVTIKIGNETWTQQLTSGNGYQVANEKVLTFGIGDHQIIDEVTVRWRESEPKTYTNLSTGRTYLCREGSGELLGIE